MQSLHPASHELPTNFALDELRRDSTIGDLLLHNVRLPLSALGQQATALFTQAPLLPGILLVEQDEFVGLISRQRFLEQMSRPYSLELFLDRPLQALFPFIRSQPLVLSHQMPIVDATRKALHRQSDWLYEPVVVKLESGDHRLLDIHHLLIAQGEIHRLTSQLLDEKTRDYLSQNEKMSSLGRMLAGVSHEIKNPVNCVSGNLEFLKTYIDSLLKLLTCYREQSEFSNQAIAQLEKDIDLEFLLNDLPNLLQSMGAASERLVDLVSSLRNFSRLDREKLQPIDIHRYIDGTLLILNNRTKLGIEVLKDYGAVPSISCYPGQLSQVLMNILSNSIDALLEKQESMRQQEVRSPALSRWDPQIRISTRSQQTDDGDWLLLQIWDNGKGIPDDVKDKIFDPFFTTKSVEQGTGLGLAISHQIITQKHNGQIEVESSPESGTTFSITLPYASQP